MGISSAAGGPRLFAAENPFCTLHLTEGRLGAWRGVAWRGRNYSEKEREARSLGFSDFYSILVPSATPPPYFPPSTFLGSDETETKVLEERRRASTNEMR